MFRKKLSALEIIGTISMGVIYEIYGRRKDERRIFTLPWIFWGRGPQN